VFAFFGFDPRPIREIRVRFCSGDVQLCRYDREER
jgi:hypothetical protein